MYYAHVKRLARLVWRYSDDAGANIENLYKFCMAEKKSGMKLQLNRVWDWTAWVCTIITVCVRPLVRTLAVKLLTTLYILITFCMHL